MYYVLMDTPCRRPHSSLVESLHRPQVQTVCVQISPQEDQGESRNGFHYYVGLAHVIDAPRLALHIL